MSRITTAETRPLRPDDLERVVAIDTLIMGRSRRKFFEKRLQAALADQAGFITMAVDGEDGTLTGFAIARIQNGEYGDDIRAAVLDVIGVDPGSRHSGTGHALLDGLINTLRKLKIGELRTQIGWQDQELASFFAGAGFCLAPEQVLERPVSRHIQGR